MPRTRRYDDDVFHYAYLYVDKKTYTFSHFHAYIAYDIDAFSKQARIYVCIYMYVHVYIPRHTVHTSLLSNPESFRIRDLRTQFTIALPFPLSAFHYSFLHRLLVPLHYLPIRLSSSADVTTGFSVLAVPSRFHPRFHLPSYSHSMGNIFSFSLLCSFSQLDQLYTCPVYMRHVAAATVRNVHGLRVQWTCYETRCEL